MGRTFYLIGLATIAVGACARAIEPLPASIHVRRAAVNEVQVQSPAGSRIAIYSLPPQQSPVQALLLTHHRRDAIGLPATGADVPLPPIVAPLAEREWIENPGEFWQNYSKLRFHDYACQTTKILTQPIAVQRWVQSGDTFDIDGLEFEVVDTPGYTRGSVSYLTELDGKRVAFTGDLIYGDGRLLDLYSLQDAIPEADIRGYHGYAGRLGALVASLERIAAWKPDVLIPSRGPVIEQPQQAIAKLIATVRSVYGDYLATNALHWYFKEARMRACGKRVLGDDSKVDLMPYSLHQAPPDWILEQATSRLIVADDGHAFLIDCGYQRVIDAVQKWIDDGVIKAIDGIFVTHYHDDHTDKVQAAADQFKCPVYALDSYVDILENPAAYNMPAMTSEPIRGIKRLGDGYTMPWRGMQFTFHDFPGQALYHGALFVRHPKDRPVFFIGDSFAPSGMDDYCLLNRNLLHRDQGYEKCIGKLQSIDGPFWLVNEHISYVFQFDADELRALLSRYRNRNEKLRELFPWDDPNYGIDHLWARFYPYAVQAQANTTIPLVVQIDNHSPTAREFEVSLHAGKGFSIVGADRVSHSIAPSATGTFTFQVKAGDRAGQSMVTASIRSSGMEFFNWTESMVSVKP